MKFNYSSSVVDGVSVTFELALDKHGVVMCEAYSARFDSGAKLDLQKLNPTQLLDFSLELNQEIENESTEKLERILLDYAAQDFEERKAVFKRNSQAN